MCKGPCIGTTVPIIGSQGSSLGKYTHSITRGAVSRLSQSLCHSNAASTPSTGSRLCLSSSHHHTTRYSTSITTVDHRHGSSASSSGVTPANGGGNGAGAGVSQHQGSSGAAAATGDCWVGQLLQAVAELLLALLDSTAVRLLLPALSTGC